MSSGLPVNTFAQAAEYRKRYLATLALEAQNDAYNLQANQVFKQTGQVSQLPDTRTTTEKLADIERLKVELRAGLLGITDGQQAAETIEQLAGDEIVFTIQQLPNIIADLKPKFSKGIPAQALLAYIRALRRKFLQTNGVSFTAQDATAQQLINAIQAGNTMMGANGGPFAIDREMGIPETPFEEPIFTPPARRFRPPMEEEPMEETKQPSLADFLSRRTRPEIPSDAKEPPSSSKKYKRQSKEEKEAEARVKAIQWLNFLDELDEPISDRPPVTSLEPEVRKQIFILQAEEWMADPGSRPYGELRPEVKEKVAELRNKEAKSKEAKSKGAEKSVGTAGEVAQIATYKSDPIPKRDAENFGPASMEEWEAFPIPNGFEPYPSTEAIAVQFLKWWAAAQVPEISGYFDPKWSSKRKLSTLKSALTPGVIQKLSMTLTDEGVDPFASPFAKISGTGVRPMFREQDGVGRYRTLPYPTMGGEGTAPSKYRILPVENRKVGNSPASRFPSGREILGYGLKIPDKFNKTKPIQVDMSKGLTYEPIYVPFGKYAVNPSKLSSGIFEIKTLAGSRIKKYPLRKLSSNLTKAMNRIVTGRGLDDYDFNDMDLGDQNFLYNLTIDAKINDRIHLPTPQRSKDGEEENRFEILRGQISSGNDNKELIKEFKRMLVKLSDDGRIKKAEAREILMDLAAMGY
jgi:hypothetical protein